MTARCLSDREVNRELCDAPHHLCFLVENAVCDVVMQNTFGDAHKIPPEGCEINGWYCQRYLHALREVSPV